MSHYMLEEIIQQPEVISRLVAGKNSKAMHEAVSILMHAIHGGEIYLVGSGSSYHSCLYARYLFSMKNNLIVNSYDRGEFEDFVPNLKPEDVVIIVSQSGETADAQHQISKIKDQKSKIIVITNSPESVLAKEADVVLDLQLGECRAVPSTKGYMAEMAIFALLSEAVAGDKSFSNESPKIIDDIERIIEQESGEIQNLADKIQSEQNIFVLGHGIGLANAFETALKIKECAKMYAEAYIGAEFRHGASSVVSANTPVIIFMADYESEEDLRVVAGEMVSRQANLIILSSHEVECSYHLKTYEHNLYSPLISIVPMQLLAYELSLAKNLNPDEPLGVSRVVR